MARRRPPRNEALSVRFGDLDSSQENDAMRERDDETVDPIDLGRDATDPEPEDPRANDPFADDTIDDDEAEALKDVSDEPEDESEVDEEEPEPDEDDPKTLRAQLEEERRLRALAERAADQRRRDLEEARKLQAEERSKRIDEDLEATRKALKGAIEEGDTDKQVELQDKLADLRAEKRATADQRPQARGDADAAPMVTINGAAAAAWAKNRAWINNPAYAEQNRDLIMLSQALVQERYDHTGSAFYQELERRLKHLHPDLFPAARQQLQRRPGKQAVGRVSRDDPPRTTAGKRTVVLDEADRRNMRRFDLDPENKEHVRAYAKEKLASAARDRSAA